MSQFRKDLVSSFIFLGLGALVLIAVPLTIKDPGVSVMGPRVFPAFIGICMVVLSLALLVVTLVKHHRETEEQGSAVSVTPEERRAALRDELRAVVLAIIVLAYSALFQAMGYFLSTFLATTAILLLFRVKKVWVYPLIYAVAFLVWLGFTMLLSVRLP